MIDCWPRDGFDRGHSIKFLIGDISPSDATFFHDSYIHLQKCFQFNNIEALEEAKKNVEMFYPVVGITEDMTKTLKVLEAKMPEMFAGASAEYFNNTNIKAFRHNNPFKLPVSKEVRDILVEKFKHEIEFYQFCKQRLEIQYKELVQYSPSTTK